MRIAVLTTGRQDWGILRSTCLRLAAHRDFELLVFAGGMCCEPRFGAALAHIEQDGLAPVERLRWVGEQVDAPAHHQTGDAVRLIGDALARHRPDTLLLVGDRFETAAAALAATLARVPIVHLHGGEETAGAFDNALRHAITKLAHLHLVSHVDHAKRVIAMGEDPASVHVVGAPGLDNVHRSDLADRAELEQFLGIELRAPVVLVTHHPATLGAAPECEIDALIAAIDRVDATYIVTLPNADPGSAAIRERLVAAVAHPRRRAADALGERRYFGLLRLADAMLGNSSSGLIEAPLLGLPVVNVGDRQKGRLREVNVLDVPPDADAITAKLTEALAPNFRAALPRGSALGDGYAAERIVEILSAWRAPVPPIKPPVSIA